MTTSSLRATIERRAAQTHQDIVAVRRHLHQHPELSFEEEKTAAYVSDQLTAMGIVHTRGVGGHGIVAMLGRDDDSLPVVALRADMDALPITEINDVPYKSQNPGVMHACGHDVHTASLLGAAQLLHEVGDILPGRVKLLFQPAEERMPGGASLMIKDGALLNPTPTSIIGQHVHPPLEAGKVGMRAGLYMASADELHVTVHGRGGHGALPHDCIDPVVITAHMLTALQQMVSRKCNPTLPSVLTFGNIQANGSTNVIPNEVKLMGTFRTMDESWRAEAHKQMKRMAEGLCESMGGSCTFTIVKGYPCLVNEPRLTERTFGAAQEYLGAENVVELPIRMTAEDFSYYSQEMAGCFYRLGTGNVAKGITSPVHTNTFDIDESALELSQGLMAWCAISELQHLSS